MLSQKICRHELFMQPPIVHALKWCPVYLTSILDPYVMNDCSSDAIVELSCEIYEAFVCHSNLAQQI